MNSNYKCWFCKLCYTLQLSNLINEYTKRNCLSNDETDLSLAEEDSSDLDSLDLESSSSEFSTCSDQEAYSSSDSDDDNAMPTDWIASGGERNPYTFRSDHRVKFTVKDKENPEDNFKKYFMKQSLLTS